MPEELGSASFGIDADITPFEKKLAEAYAEASAFADKTDKKLSDLQMGFDDATKAVSAMNREINTGYGTKPPWQREQDAIKAMRSATKELTSSITDLNKQIQDNDQHTIGWGQRIIAAFTGADTSAKQLGDRLDGIKTRLDALDTTARKQIKMGLNDEAQNTILTMKNLQTELDNVQKRADKLGYTMAVGPAGGGGGGGGFVPPVARGGGGNGYPWGSLLYNRGRGRFGIPAGLTGFSLLHMLGLGPEHVIGTAGALVGSAGGALLGAGLLGAGKLGTMAVGGGSDMAVMKSTIADTKTLYTAYTNLQNAIAQYGKNSKAAAQAQAALNMQMKALGPGAKFEFALAKQVDALNTQWDKVTTGARQVATQILSQVVDLGNAYVGRVADAAKANLTIINAGIKPLFTWLKGPEGVKIWNDLENIFKANLPTAVHAFTQAVEVALKIVDDAAQYTGGLTRTLDKFFTKWNAKNKEYALAAWVNHWMDDLDQWKRLIKAMFTDLHALFKAGSNDGMTLVGTLTAILEKWGAWMNSVKGQDFLHTFFENRKYELLAIFNLLGALLRPVAALYAAVQPLVPLVTALFNIIAKVINAIVDLGKKGNIAGQALTGALGFLLISAKVAGITKTIGLVTGAVRLLATAWDTVTGSAKRAEAAQAAGYTSAKKQTTGGVLSKVLGSGTTSGENLAAAEAGQVWGMRNTPIRPGSMLNPIAVVVIDQAALPGSAGKMAQAAENTAATDAMGLTGVAGLKSFFGNAMKGVMAGGAVIMGAQLLQMVLPSLGVGKGVTHAVGNVGTGAGIGAGIGSVIPGVGTVLGGLIGGGVGLLNSVSGLGATSDITHYKQMQQGIKEGTDKSTMSLQAFLQKVKDVQGELGQLSPAALAQLKQQAQQLAADPSLSKYHSQLQNIASALGGNGLLPQALSQVKSAFAITQNAAGQDLHNIQAAVDKSSSWIETTLPPRTQVAAKALSANFLQAAKDVQTSMAQGVVSTASGLSQINKYLAQALNAIGSPVKPSDIAAIGMGQALALVGWQNSGATGTVGPGHFATGGRVPGAPGPDNWTLLDPTGRPAGMVSGSELLIANRHTEARINKMLGVFGTSLGEQVLGEKRPNNLPGYAKGGYTGYSLPLPRGSMMPGSWSIDQGVDIPAGAGTPEFAIGPGVITQEGISGFGPNAPILRVTAGPLAGMSFYYGHAGPDLVPVGAHVRAGQQISAVGSGIVGISTGPHIEFGVWPSHGGSQAASILKALMSGAGITGAMGGGFGQIPNVKAKGVKGLMSDIVQGALNTVVSADNNYLNSLMNFSAGAAGVPAHPVGNIMQLAQMAAQAAGVPWNPGIVQELLSKESNGGMNLPPHNYGNGLDPAGPFQVISSTFAAYERPGHSNRMDPFSNALAAMFYIKSRYGNLSNLAATTGLYGPGYVGYKMGGLVEAATGTTKLGKGVFKSLAAKTKAAQAVFRKPKKQNLTPVESLLSNFAEFNDISGILNTANPYDLWDTSLTNQYGLLSNILGQTNPDGTTHFFLSSTDGPPSDTSLVNTAPSLPGLKGVRWPTYGNNTLIYDAETINQNTLLQVYQMKAAAWGAALHAIAVAMAERKRRMANIARYYAWEKLRKTSIQNDLNALQGKGLRNRLTQAVSDMKRGNKLGAARNMLFYLQGLSSTWSKGRTKRVNDAQTTLAHLYQLLFDEEQKGPGADPSYLASLRQKIFNTQQYINGQQSSTSPWSGEIRQEQAQIRLLSRNSHAQDRVTSALMAIRKHDLTDELKQINSDMSQLGGSSGTGGFYGKLNTQYGQLANAQQTFTGDMNDLNTNIIPNIYLNLRSIADAKATSGWNTPNPQSPTSSADLISAQAAVIGDLARSLFVSQAQYGVLSNFVGSFAVGTTNVPRTGMALIHEGEAIIPASLNPFTKVGGSGDAGEGIHVNIYGLGDFVDRVEAVIDGKVVDITNQVSQRVAGGARARRLLPTTNSAGSLTREHGKFIG